MTKFIDYTLNGISNGAIYAAVALALVLIWRATRIVNFAQGAMLMITTYIASAVIDSTGSYVLGFVVALAAGLVIGALVERLLMRRVENGPPLNAVIVTLGLYTFLVALAGMIWGNTPRGFPPALSLIRGYDIGGQRYLFAPNDTFIVLVVVFVAVALAALFRYTPLGLQMRGRRVQAGGGAAARRAGRADVHLRLGAGRAHRRGRRRAGRAVGVRGAQQLRSRS